jgi:16S rRNA (uracil1498-N3)-methyltransferase
MSGADGAGAADGAPRLFVAPGSLAAGRASLGPAAAARLLDRGVRAGQAVVLLDDSGWEYRVQLEAIGPEGAAGAVAGRRLATERRTKVSLFQALLHPSDFRRLLTRATDLGVVAFVPVIADGSVVPVLDEAGRPEGGQEWPRLVRDAAEAGQRGRLPSVAAPMLLDHALDGAARGGSVLMAAPLGEAIDAVLAERPFSLALFCPPPGGFTAEELARAEARSVRRVRVEPATRDPIQPALTLLAAVYAQLEPVPGAG